VVSLLCLLFGVALGWTLCAMIRAAASDPFALPEPDCGVRKLARKALFNRGFSGITLHETGPDGVADVIVIAYDAVYFDRLWGPELVERNKRLEVVDDA